jgi:hypothetical protein
MTRCDPNFRIDFIGIGAARSGTTWLADNLRKHPQIFIPDKKELVFFNKYDSRFVGVENPGNKRSIEEYHTYFDGAGKEQLKGEICIEYLTDPQAPQNIYRYNPEVKIIAILRAPHERMLSHYLYYRRKGVFKYSNYLEAIDDRPDLFGDCCYYKHLKRYYDLFSSSQIKVLFFHDMISDNKAFFKSAVNFLRASEFYPDNLNEKINRSTRNRLPVLNAILQSGRNVFTKRSTLAPALKFLKLTGITKLGTFIRDKVNSKQIVEKPNLPKDLENRIREHNRPEIEKLEALCGVDLTHWK